MKKRTKIILVVSIMILSTYLAIEFGKDLGVAVYDFTH